MTDLLREGSSVISRPYLVDIYTHKTDKMNIMRNERKKILGLGLSR